MLKMHESQNTILDFSRTNRFRISQLWIVLDDVRVWIDSRGVKESVGHLKIDGKRLEVWLHFAWEARFFELATRVLEPIFPPLLDRYASCIYTGWIWSGFGKELINIQCKSNLIFVQNQIFKIWLIFNPILPYWSNFEICWPLWVAWISRKE